MTASTLEELFEHELEDIYFAENELYDVLGDLADQVESDEAQSAIEEHREETDEHIDRLEEVFDTIGEPPEKEECEGIEGIVTEQEEFADQDPPAEVLDLFNLAAAQKTEHYEIAAYGNTILLADQLGYDDAADLLEQNLREEQDALEELSEIAENYDFESVPRE